MATPRHSQIDFSSHPVGTKPESLESSLSDSNKVKTQEDSEALKDLPGLIKAQNHIEEKQLCLS